MTASPVRIAAMNEPMAITFSPGGSTVFRITSDGRLEPGDGLSDDVTTRRLFDAMAIMWPKLIEQWAIAQGWTKP